MTQSFVGLVGWPVSHSASPAMMNQAFLHTGRNAIYLPFAVRPEDIETALNGLSAIGAHGVNVTIPHKTHAFDWVSSRTDEANLAGAVNTIRFDRVCGHVGHNTDVIGWWTSIKPFLSDSIQEVAVLGAGGASLAVLAALTLYRNNVHVHIVAREGQNRRSLYTRFSSKVHVQVADWDLRNQVVEKAQLVVNTTPIGMWPNMGQSAIEDKSVFHDGQVVQDIVYRPLQTRFMELAKAGGATIVDGLSMLVGQGASAYEWWFDEHAPVDLMYEAAKQFVGANSGP